MSIPRPILTFAEVINEYLTFNHALQCKTPDGMGTLAAVDVQGNVIVKFPDAEKHDEFHIEIYSISKITPIFKPFEALADNIIATGLVATLCHVAEGTEINPIREICKMVNFQIDNYEIINNDNHKYINISDGFNVITLMGDDYQLGAGINCNPDVFLFLKLLHQNIFNVAPCIYS